MSRVVLVTGTGGTKQEHGWHIDGPFVDDLEEYGIRRLDTQIPFYWSSNLDGLFGDNYDWKAAGHSLRDYIHARMSIRRQRIEPIDVIGHSHALAVLAYSAFYGQKYGCVVTVGGPYRDMMEEQYEALAQNSRIWIHFHSGWRDPWAWYGSIRPGRLWGNSRKNKFASQNYVAPKENHTGLLKVSHLLSIGAIEEMVDLMKLGE